MPLPVWPVYTYVVAGSMGNCGPRDGHSPRYGLICKSLTKDQYDMELMKEKYIANIKVL